MSVQESIGLCLILEKMERKKEFTKRLELENNSKLHGKTIEKR